MELIIELVLGCGRVELAIIVSYRVGCEVSFVLWC